MSKRSARRRRRSGAEWALIMQRFHASKLDVRTFCAQEGIGYASFYAWRHKLEENDARSGMEPVPSVPSSMPFIELGTLASSGPMPLEVEVELGGQVVLRLKRSG